MPYDTRSSLSAVIKHGNINVFITDRPDGQASWGLRFYVRREKDAPNKFRRPFFQYRATVPPVAQEIPRDRREFLKSEKRKTRFASHTRRSYLQFWIHLRFMKAQLGCLRRALTVNANIGSLVWGRRKGRWHREYQPSTAPDYHTSQASHSSSHLDSQKKNSNWFSPSAFILLLIKGISQMGGFWQIVTGKIWYIRYKK